MSLTKALVVGCLYYADAFRTRRVSNDTGIQIVNGYEAELGEFPWQVGILSRNREGSMPWCGGMLISDQWVLSAAHCFQRTRGVTVLVGGHEPTKTSPNHQFINTQKIINHPEYDLDRKGSWDFSLLKLEKPIKRTQYASPVALPYDGDVQDGTTCDISGWGTTRSGGSQSDVLLGAEVSYITNADCVGRKYGYRSRQITPSMMCAQGRNANGDVTDGCQGDSGGPLVCMKGGKPVLYGATSWGYGCADPYYPGVWARVYEALDWIDANVD